MNQIFIANPKGGCGKTTISAQLAAYYAIQGCSVLLVDHDAQRSSSDWLACRPSTRPPIQSITSSADTPVSTHRADIIIHDMPAAWSLDSVVDIMHPGDKVLIPVLASPTDIKACLRFVMGLFRTGVMERGIRAGMIANRSRERTRYFKVLIEFLQRIDLPLVASLRDTQTYVRVMDRGLTIFDLPSGRVAEDLKQWQPILHWLDAESQPEKNDAQQQQLEPA